MKMPKLMLLSDWSKARFLKPPARKTMLGWCENGHVPAKKIGGQWYIEAERELTETGDPLVDEILRSKQYR